jgi:hypothetical protein
MITFPHLGYLGRLGNQMFQYATLFSMAKKYNTNYSICSPKFELLECFNISAKINSLYNFDFILSNGLDSSAVRSGAMVYYVGFDEFCKLFTTNFDQSFFDTNPDEKSICGFFQNYNYFKNVENDLRKEYTFKKIYEDKCNYYINQNFKDDKIISLHIRRTDYLNSDVLNRLDILYYKNALEHFDKSISVLVFSDDTDWCQDQNIFKDDRFKIIKTNNTYIDLCLMSKCHYHIIANSTFSWWGSWLADSEKTICPKDWFYPQYTCLDSEGLRLKKWIAI